MRVLVVIPTYNEAENVAEVLARTAAAVPTAEVLIVDDGSPDGTGDLVESIAATNERVHLLRRTQKSGLGAAYRAGFAWGAERGFDVLVEMDADLSHDPAALPSLLHEIEQGADLVIGSRYVPGGSIPTWSFRRRALSRYGNIYASLLLGVGVKDLTSGYRAYRAEAVRALSPERFRSHGYTFQIETAYAVWQNGGTIREVPITFTDRLQGTSKMSGFIVVEALSRMRRTIHSLTTSATASRWPAPWK